MTRAPDTSLILAALLTDQEGHDPAEAALLTCTATIAHTAMETYGVLTRLPPPQRLLGADAATLIEQRLPSQYVTLNKDNSVLAARQLATAGVSGGATYDGLIALAALAHDLELVSRDARAARTYRALGTKYQLIE